MQRLPLIELHGTLPAGRIIPAQQLEALVQQTAEWQDVEQTAASLIRETRQQAAALLRQTRKTCRQMQAKQQQVWEQQQQVILRQCEVQWLQENITRLVQDEQQEQAMVTAVSTRIHHCMEQVLRAWFDQQSPEEALCARLSRQAEEMAGEGMLTLHIHPDRMEGMRDVFASRFVLVPEPDFPVDRAVLSSSRLSVTFSLSDHFQQLLDWLHSAEPAGGVINENC